MNPVHASPDVLEGLYKARKGAVDFIDVPELSFAVVKGRGAPGSLEFRQAIEALYAVSYGAHFRIKKDLGESTRIMPVEALWWFDDPAQQDIADRVALGETTMAETDTDAWRWQAMIVQPEPIDRATVARAVEEARHRQLPALGRLGFEQWTEGRCAQTLHIGPYADEGPTIARLHRAIVDAGLQPRGRHHEIYLGDPRRSAPEKLRTLIRHPVE